MRGHYTEPGLGQDFLRSVNKTVGERRHGYLNRKKGEYYVTQIPVAGRVNVSLEWRRRTNDFLYETKTLRERGRVK